MVFQASYIFALIFGISGTAAVAETSIAGNYDCVVHEKAGIASIHLEDADPPAAYLEHKIQSTFGLKIESASREDFSYKISETHDRGENPDRMEYQSLNSVLHGTYYGDGSDFSAVEDQAFLRIFRRNSNGLYFYHAGFEYPGSVDVRLSVRYGQCEPRN